MNGTAFHLDILVGMEDGDYVAHCLQLDLVASAPTAEAVVKDITDLIRAHLLFAIEHDNMDNVFRPAPPEYWQKLWRVKQLTDKPRCQRHTFEVQNRVNEADFCYA